MKSDYVKSLMLLSMVFFVIGCGTYQTRHCYSPQNTPNWENVGNRNYKFKCKGGEIEVSPIVLSTTEVKEQEKPWILVFFRRPSRIKNCNLSFVTLENKISGVRVEPTSAKTNVLNDDNFEKKTTYCYYYFDIKEDKNSSYILHISDEVCDCKVDSIPYMYEETTKWEAIQFQ